MRLKDKLTREKPWVRLGWSRREYENRRPWTHSSMTRQAYESMLENFPPEAIKLLKDDVDAERLAEAIFGAAALEPSSK